MKTQHTLAKTFVSTIRLVAALVVLSVQLGVVGAGVLDAREGSSAASHLEGGGTNLHFAHNEADCFMCRAQHLGDAAPFNIEAPSPVLPPSPEVAARALRIVAAEQPLSNASRAPPVAV